MISQYETVYQKTQTRLHSLYNEYGQEDLLRSHNEEKFKSALDDVLKGEAPEIRQRILCEYFDYGPLQKILEDESITEILVNGPKSIWFEKAGRLFHHEDLFLSSSSYMNILQRLCDQARCQSTVEHPAGTGQFQDFRLTLIRQELTQSAHHLSLRRHPKNPWTLDKLESAQWASSLDIRNLKNLMLSKKNFLIVGGTGSGKTSLINALLQTLGSEERAIVIEDTPEITLPNACSMKMITREDPQGILSSVDQSHLLKHSLRLRPDRLIMGEIRGAEAKDLLMSLATGHGGSFGTLHANDPRQALIRLEMLIQIGAPQWSLTAVRRLIHLSLSYILVVEKTAEGKRQLQGIYKICSLEENGLLIEKVSDENWD